VIPRTNENRSLWCCDICDPERAFRVYQPRGQLTASLDGKLADGTYAPSGVYKLAVKAVPIFGDPKLTSEYDSTETVPFKIRYSKL